MVPLRAPVPVRYQEPVPVVGFSILPLLRGTAPAHIHFDSSDWFTVKSIHRNLEADLRKLSPTSEKLHLAVHKQLNLTVEKSGN